LFRPLSSSRRLVTALHSRISRLDELPRRTRLLIAVLAVELVVAISYVILRFASELQGLAQYGYIGAFLSSLISAASIILPIPGFVVIATIAALPDTSWPLVALASALGNALGESTAYLAGYGGTTIIQPERSKLYLRAERWMKRNGYITVFVFALTPLPFDVVGIAAGALRFPFWKFFLAVLSGRLPLTIVGCYLAHTGWERWPSLWSSLREMDWWGWLLATVSVISIIAIGTFLWRSRRRTRALNNSKTDASNTDQPPPD